MAVKMKMMNILTCWQTPNKQSVLPQISLICTESEPLLAVLKVEAEIGI